MKQPFYWTKSADLEIALFNLFILYGFIQNCKYEQSSRTQMAGFLQLL